jgi:hypothetical protein
MITAVIDNGSLAPAAHRNLRALAAALTKRTGVEVHPVSWKHSDRIPPDLLEGRPGATLDAWLKHHFTRGERDFLFIPFFVSSQGAIGSWLRKDVERLRAELGGFRFAFTSGLASRGVLAPIAADRIRQTVARYSLDHPSVIVVDHGGPSRFSAELRDEIAADVRELLHGEIGPLAAASLEGSKYPHNMPLFADALSLEGFDQGDVIIAPLFLAPGRHAGPRGDLAEIATAAEDRLTAAPLRCHFTELPGTHPRILDALAGALLQATSNFSAAA